MKNNILLVIYLLSTLSISAMDNKIIIQNCTKSSVIFSYKRHDLINIKLEYINYISIFQYNIISFPYDTNARYSIIKITNYLCDYIKLKYSNFHNLRKKDSYTKYLYTNETIIIDQDVKLLIPLIFQKIFLKKEYTNDEFFIQ